MAVDSVNFYAPQSNADTGAAATARPVNKALGQEEFLKLLAVQFQSQDPMKPMEDTAFIAQMAQFTALEQSGAMSATMAQLRSEQQVGVANSYLGLFAVVEDAAGNLKSGQITAVDTTTNKPMLEIDGAFYDLSAVLRTEHPAFLFPGTDATDTNADTGA